MYSQDPIEVINHYYDPCGHSLKLYINSDSRARLFNFLPSSSGHRTQQSFDRSYGTSPSGHLLGPRRVAPCPHYARSHAATSVITQWRATNVPTAHQSVLVNRLRLPFGTARPHTARRRPSVLRRPHSDATALARHLRLLALGSPVMESSFTDATLTGSSLPCLLSLSSDMIPNCRSCPRKL